MLRYFVLRFVLLNGINNITERSLKAAGKKAKPIKNKSRQKRNLRVSKKYLTINRSEGKKNLYQCKEKKKVNCSRQEIDVLVFSFPLQCLFRVLL